MLVTRPAAPLKPPAASLLPFRSRPETLEIATVLGFNPRYDPGTFKVPELTVRLPVKAVTVERTTLPLVVSEPEPEIAPLKVIAPVPALVTYRLPLVVTGPLKVIEPLPALVT